MKIIIGVILLLSFSAVAEEIKVSKMTQDRDLERSFVLKTNLSQKVVLDCQSFIQGLRIGEQAQAYTYLLDEQECHGLQNRIRSSLRRFQHHCIDVGDDVRSDRSCF